MKKIILGYIAIIFLGAFILTLPISSRDGIHTSFEDALFTSTSATCVTGLVVQDTATYWSLFGQIVILCLIEIGGLGFMTLAVCAMTFTKKNIGLQSRYTLLESINAPQMAGIVENGWLSQFEEHFSYNARRSTFARNEICSEIRSLKGTLFFRISLCFRILQRRL